MTDAALEAGLAQWRAAVAADPGNARAHAMLGLTLQQAGQLADAVASQRRALELDPGFTLLHESIGGALLALGQHEAAAASLRQALAAGPGQAVLYRGLAEALHGARDLQGAADAWRRVLEAEPDDAAAWLRLTAILHQLHQYEAAHEACARVLALAPQCADAHHIMAEGWRALDRPREAEDCYRLALAQAPEHPGALHGLGLALQARGASAEALDALQRALAANPGNAAICNQIGLILLELARQEEALAMFQRALALAPGSTVAHSNVLYTLSHLSTDPVQLFQAHRDYAARHEAPLRAHWQPHPNTRDPGRPLRVGIVSADLMNHAVASFIEPVLALLGDSPELSLTIYDNGERADEVTARLRGHVRAWRAIRHLDDEAAAALVRQDAIDVLIDLSGHTAGNRLPLFARKPAPVQASWIGYAGTTGLAAMDYYISDGFHLPEGRYDDQFTEQIVRLPLAAHFAAPHGAPAPGPLPALANGHLTFGSFNRASKLGRPVIALWARLLRAVPDAKLLLAGLAPGAEDTLLPWFEQEGIGRARLALHPRLAVGHYLALHQQVDLCLSPFPYSGATTICNAAWMGVPSLAVIGPTNPSHSAAWFLAHLGLDAFVAHDEDTFVQLGVFLSHNLAELAELRAGLRQRFAQSVAGYPEITAGGLQLALRRMWQHWCAGLPPTPLRVGLDEVLAPPAPA